MKTLIIAIILLAPLSAQAHAPHIITLATKVKWEPYHLDIESGADGIAVRALACVMARINQPYVIHKVPWSRAQGLVKTGKVDGFFSASRNVERDSYATLSEVFIPQTRAFYTLKTHLPTSLDDYTIDYIHANIVVAARTASNALTSLKNNGFTIAGTPKSEDLLFKMINAPRVGAIFENRAVFKRLLKSEESSFDDYVEVVFETKNMGVYFGQPFLLAHPNFLEMFNSQVPHCSLLESSEAEHN